MLAFLISAHTDPQQLKRLIEALPDEARFFVHIDQKSDLRPFTKIITDTRVHFLQQRVNVVWGSIIETEYQMLLVEAALQAPEHFDYLITLSGLDYPAWSKERITRFFREADGKEFITGNDLSGQLEGGRLYREYRFLATRPWQKGSLPSKLRVAMRRLVSGVGIHKPLVFSASGREYHLFKGAAWWAITADLAQFILEQWKTNTQFVDYFRTSFGPAETFAQTIAFNSPEWRPRCIEHKGAWQSMKEMTPLTYIHYHPVIKIMEEEDVPRVLDSGMMFARKVITGKSDAFVQMLEAKKSNR